MEQVNCAGLHVTGDDIRSNLTQTSKIQVSCQLCFNGKAEIILFEFGSNFKICEHSMILSAIG